MYTSQFHIECHGLPSCIYSILHSNSWNELCLPSSPALLFFDPNQVLSIIAVKRHCHSPRTLCLPFPLTTVSLSSLLSECPKGQSAPLHVRVWADSVSLSLRLRRGPETLSPGPVPPDASFLGNISATAKVQGRNQDSFPSGACFLFLSFSFLIKENAVWTVHDQHSNSPNSEHSQVIVTTRCLSGEKELEFHIFLLLFSTLNICPKFKLRPRECYC